jgi:hypothetical protein
MFGADFNRYKTIEEILCDQKYTQTSYTKNWAKWKEGKHLEKVFYEVAKKNNLTYDEVKEIFFASWALIDNHTRHIDFPTIVIPCLGELKPNAGILSKQIKTGEYYEKLANEHEPEKGRPLFLQKLEEARQRVKVESIYKHPDYYRRNEITDEQVEKIWDMLRQKQKARKAFVWYLITFGKEQGEKYAKIYAEQIGMSLDRHELRLNKYDIGLY